MPVAAEIQGGPNGALSLSEARENFKNNLVKYGSTDPRLGGADNAIEKQANASMIAAFEQMYDETNTDVLDKLWERVNQSRNILSKEITKKILEHDKKNKK